MSKRKTSFSIRKSCIPTLALRVMMVMFTVYPNIATPNSPLFPYDSIAAEPITAEIKLPLSNLRAASPQHEQETEFSAQITLADQTVVPIKIRARGKSRREKCSFPPLRLNFAATTAKGTVFEKQDKLKLVTHCKSTMSDRSYLASEMLAYRILNLLTDYSFRVRAMDIHYVNTNNNKAEFHRGFVIEHKDDLAKRLGLGIEKSAMLRLAQLDTQQAAIVALFQYAIGNTDYSMIRGPTSSACCHNMVPFVSQSLKSTKTNDASGQKILAVPYDFDVTGLVNAPYATPPASVRIKKVTQRLYRGYCKHNDALPPALTKILDNKERILALVASFDDIPNLNRRRTLSYLQKFFDIISNDKQIQRRILRKCR